jgi:hypothetical protein
VKNNMTQVPDLCKQLRESHPRNVPTLWVALSWMDTFSGQGKHSQCRDVSPSKICISQKEVVPLREINKKSS